MFGLMALWNVFSGAAGSGSSGTGSGQGWPRFRQSLLSGFQTFLPVLDRDVFTRRN